MKKTVLIGGAGFLGSSLSSVLINTDRKITVIGRGGRPITLNRDVAYIQSDCSNNQELQNYLDGAAEIVDLSYTTTPKTSFENPIFDITQNLPRAVKLFEIASKMSSLEKLLVISSGGTVYGPATVFPIPESATTTPVSPYGITKLTIEKYAQMYEQIYGLPIIIVRPANVYGPRKNIDYSQGFIPIAFKKILNKQAVEIYGEQGTVRDYVFINDVAEAIAAILNSERKHTIFNIGTGLGTDTVSVLKLIEKIVSKDGYQVVSKKFPTRVFDVPENILDSSLLLKQVGWKAKTSLTDGLKHTWNLMMKY
jgi:UDP-glucose 4-epimerase